VRPLGAHALIALSALVLSILSTCDALAAWPSDPHTHLPICTAAGDQEFAEVVSDGEGGAVVCWHDGRLGYPNLGVYAQRVSAGGVRLWTPDGVALSSSSREKVYPILTGDGAAGAFVVWSEAPGLDQFPDVYAQHVDGAGNLHWGPTGTLVCAAAMGQFPTGIISDGSGGVIVSWLDGRDNQFAVYVQRLTANGQRLWGNGIALTSAAQGSAYFIGMVADGSGGAILTWQDSRNYFNDVFVQRIDSDGHILWTPHGVQLTSNFAPQSWPWIVSDGAHGAIVVWVDERDGYRDIYAQRVDGTGAPQWTDEGVPVCVAGEDQTDVQLVSDGTGGAIICWQDRRPELTDQDVYAQRISASGVPQWTLGGVPVCAAPGYQYYPTPVSDGAGGAIIWWNDQRTPGGTYAQRIDATGQARWEPDGIPVSLIYAYPVHGTTDSAGGAILAWHDNRSGSADIYGQRLSPPAAHAGGPYRGVVGMAVSFSGEGSTDPGDDPLTYAWDFGDGYAGTGNAPTHVYASADRFHVALRVSDGLVTDVDTTTAVIDPMATPTLLSLVSAQATPERVRLTWYAAGAGNLTATVYRRTTSDEWSALAQASTDGTGQIVYEDADVLAGTRIGYRLGVMENGREAFMGETWVDVPRALGLALTGPHPNPSLKDLTIAFSLSDDSPARLEVLDLTGRRMCAREVGGLGPGSHVLPLVEGRALAAGVYLLRLTQRGRSVTGRAVIIR
jgi:hypothetical protein